MEEMKPIPDKPILWYKLRCIKCGHEDKYLTQAKPLYRAKDLKQQPRFCLFCKKCKAKNFMIAIRKLPDPYKEK